MQAQPARPKRPAPDSEPWGLIVLEIIGYALMFFL